MTERALATKSARKTRKPAMPRYLQLAGDLREAIMGGEFVDGAQFPTESALCERYKVSRFTVREALRRLQAEGLIERKRGSGTTVQRAAARGGTLHQPLSNVGEILQYARDTQVVYALSGHGPLPAGVAEQIGAGTAGEWTCLHGVRRHEFDALPIASTQAYFHERLADAVERLDLAAGTLFSQIERLAGIAIGKVTQDIQAVAADAGVADALELEPDAPVLRILRCYYGTDGELFEISVSHHPGDRFAYSMHIDLDH